MYNAHVMQAITSCRISAQVQPVSKHAVPARGAPATAAAASPTLVTGPTSLSALHRDTLLCQLDQSAGAQHVQKKQQQPQKRRAADPAAAGQPAVSSEQPMPSQSMPSLSNSARALDQRVVGWTEVRIFSSLLIQESSSSPCDYLCHDLTGSCTIFDCWPSCSGIVSLNHIAWRGRL